MDTAQFFGLLWAFVPFAFVIAITIIKLGARARRDVQRHETIRLLVEKGQPIPPELLRPETDDKPHDPAGDFRAGLILLAVAIGLFVFLSRMPAMPHGLEWVAIIPGLIGIAMIVGRLLFGPAHHGRGQPPKA